MVILLNAKGFAINAPIEYKLSPGKALILVNTSSTVLNVSCQMGVASDPSHSISINALSGNGQINGTSISKGQTMIVTVRNMQVIPITASPRASASFTNLGPYVVIASCV